MLKKSAFPMMLGLLLSFFVAILLPEVVYFLAHQGLAGYTVEQFLKDFIINLSVGFFVGSVLPAANWGAALAGKIGIKNENSLPFHLVRTFVIAFVMVLIMSLVLMFLEMGFVPGFFGIWSKMAPIILAVVYVYLLIVLPISAKICMKLCTED